MVIYLISSSHLNLQFEPVLLNKKSPQKLSYNHIIFMRYLPSEDNSPPGENEKVVIVERNDTSDIILCTFMATTLSVENYVQNLNACSGIRMLSG